MKSLRVHVDQALAKLFVVMPFPQRRQAPVKALGLARIELTVQVLHFGIEPVGA